ncbi:YgjV family protein [Roseateles sp. BYS87W]|uniref:YgjV family protein n=1 Tax=Pelomonas baiyunensis TaxID=3299026 RepID=A0ABW7H3W2_9BURK
MAAFTSPAQWLGYLAFALGVACFAQSNDRRFKLFMAGECAAYIGHFLLLGQPTAVASTSVSLLRSLAALRWRGPRVGLSFMALSLALGGVFMHGALSLLPIAASCIGTFALFFLQGLRMRLLMLGGTLLWLVNNLCVGSIGGSLLELVLAVTNARTCWRLHQASQVSKAPGG